MFAVLLHFCSRYVALKAGLEVFKVIETGAIRKFGCSFLFSFHSNCGAILYHLRDIATYW